MALNPMDGNDEATWLPDRVHRRLGAGCALIERAMALNPHHPGWFWLPIFYNEYREATTAPRSTTRSKVNMPGLSGRTWCWPPPTASLVSARPRADALQQLLALKPDLREPSRDDWRSGSSTRNSSST